MVKAIAQYDYKARAEDELTFNPNDVITNIDMVFTSTISVIVVLGMIDLYLSFVLLLCNHRLIRTEVYLGLSLLGNFIGRKSFFTWHLNGGCPLSGLFLLHLCPGLDVLFYCS